MTTLLNFESTNIPGQATLTVETSQRSQHPITPRLWGKFCEHLGTNIYHGMDAQILLNCTLAKWRFSAGDNHPNGGVREESNREKITQRIMAIAERNAWPDPHPLLDAYFDGGAFGWFRIGDQESVSLSPDVGCSGQRAQRVEIKDTSASGCGIGQWTYLPLQRTHTFTYRIVARAMEPSILTMNLAPVDSPDVAGCTRISVGQEWQTITGEICIPANAPEMTLYQFVLTSDKPANIVLDRVLLYPEDHVNGADPDVIRLLKDARLPLLRWPGGNFVSGYHWRDGVGPVDDRLTLPNPAWEGLEFNLFGTDEFMAFCKAVECEPMICVNAGDGTPEEAAAWVEYCNGSIHTPMGGLRAANGHPEPYNVAYWEIGNEIYGHWQVGWTTPAGNVDRYHRFRTAMLAADPALQLLGCGHGNEPDSIWNRQLITDAGVNLRCITDHILTGGNVDADTDPVELYHAFMGYPSVLEQRYRDLQSRMCAAGNTTPHMAITELQLFAHFHGPIKPDGLFTPELLPRPDTIAEALSLAQVINTCIRLDNFVELITHSAIVNHGGGLRKERERVYANPVHYAHKIGIAMAGGMPVTVHLASETFSTQHSFAHIPPHTDVPIIDASAAIAEDGSLTILVIHRSAKSGPVELLVTLEDFLAQPTAEIVILAGDTWYSRNTLDNTENVVPMHTQAPVADGQHLTLSLLPFSLTRITLKPAKVLVAR